MDEKDYGFGPDILAKLCIFYTLKDRKLKKNVNFTIKESNFENLDDTSTPPNLNLLDTNNKTDLNEF